MCMYIVFIPHTNIILPTLRVEKSRSSRKSRQLRSPVMSTAVRFITLLCPRTLHYQCCLGLVDRRYAAENIDGVGSLCVSLQINVIFLLFSSRPAYNKRRMQAPFANSWMRCCVWTVHIAFVHGKFHWYHEYTRTYLNYFIQMVSGTKYYRHS